MAPRNQILVGKIVAPQGIRGEVRVQTFSEKPNDFQNFRIQSDKFKPDDFRFVRALPNTNVIIAKITGVDNRNTAETLRGTELYINRADLPQPNANEYYQADLIGMRVVRDNEQLGVVVCFQNFGAGDIIELDNGDMVSFVGASVDFNNNTIIVK